MEGASPPLPEQVTDLGTSLGEETQAALDPADTGTREESPKFERRPHASSRRSSSRRPANASVSSHRRRSRRNPTVVYGGAAVGAIVLLVGFNLIVWRDSLSRTSPVIEKLYNAVSLGPSKPHVRREDFKALRIAYPPPPPARLVSEGRLQQRITGSIENPSSKTIRIPPLKGSMLDAEGNVVFSWTFPPPVPELQPGMTVTFDTTVEDFPPNARRLRISFDMIGADDDQDNRKG